MNEVKPAEYTVIILCASKTSLVRYCKEHFRIVLFLCIWYLLK